MKPTPYLLLASLLSSILFLGCNSESNSSNGSKPSQETVLGKVALDNGWARPGSEQDKSAAYLQIINGTASVDTLLSVSSNAAQKVKLHKSVENKDGTIEMSPADRQVIAPGEKLLLEPGGLHLMFIDLEHDLATGDSLSLSLEFARAGTATITISVKIQK